MKFKIEFEMDIPESVATEKQAIEFFKYKLGVFSSSECTTLTDNWDIQASSLDITRIT